MRRDMNEANGIDKCDPIDCATCDSDCGGINLSDRIIELPMEDGEKVSSLVVLRYAIEERRYAAVMPLKDNPEGDIYIFRVVRDGRDLENIENEKEYEEAAYAFGVEMEKAQEERLKKDAEEAAKGTDPE